MMRISNKGPVPWLIGFVAVALVSVGMSVGVRGWRGSSEPKRSRPAESGAASVPPGKGSAKPITALTFVDDQQVAIGHCDGSIGVYFVQSGRMSSECPSSGSPIISIAAQSVRKHLFSASQDGNLVEWDLSTRDRVRDITAGSNRLVRFAPDFKHVAVVLPDNTISIRDWPSDSEAIRIESVVAGINGLAFGSGGRRLAAALADGTIKLWDVSTGRDQATLKGHLGAVNSVAYDPTRGDILASAGADGSIRLWNLTDSKNIITHKDFHHDVDLIRYHPHNADLVAVARDGTIKVWSTGEHLRQILPYRVPLRKPGPTRPLKGEILKRRNAPTGLADSTTIVAFSPSGDDLAVASGARVDFYNPNASYQIDAYRSISAR